VHDLKGTTRRFVVAAADTSQFVLCRANQREQQSVPSIENRESRAGASGRADVTAASSPLRKRGRRLVVASGWLANEEADPITFTPAGIPLHCSCQSRSD
jgi:hypothetical protein